MLMHRVGGAGQPLRIGAKLLQLDQGKMLDAVGWRMAERAQEFLAHQDGHVMRFKAQIPGGFLGATARRGMFQV